MITIVNVYLTSFFIGWIKDSNAEGWIGYIYAFASGIMLILALFLRHRFFFYGKTTGLNINKAISGMIFNK